MKFLIMLSFLTGLTFTASASSTLDSFVGTYQVVGKNCDSGGFNIGGGMVGDTLKIEQTGDQSLMATYFNEQAARHYGAPARVIDIKGIDDSAEVDWDGYTNSGVKVGFERESIKARIVDDSLIIRTLTVNAYLVFLVIPAGEYYTLEESYKLDSATGDLTLYYRTHKMCTLQRID